MRVVKKTKDGSTHGGKRAGSGRPRCEDTATVSFRVKSRFKDEIKKACEDLIRDYVRKQEP